MFYIIYKHSFYNFNIYWEGYVLAIKVSNDTKKSLLFLIIKRIFTI